MQYTLKYCSTCDCHRKHTFKPATRHQRLGFELMCQVCTATSFHYVGPVDTITVITERAEQVPATPEPTPLENTQAYPNLLGESKPKAVPTPPHRDYIPCGDGTIRYYTPGLLIEDMPIARANQEYRMPNNRATRSSAQVMCVMCPTSGQEQDGGTSKGRR
jgi:hypothetical protein